MRDWARVDRLRPCTGSRASDTEDYDRGEKLAHYKTIPTLREILLVAQEEQRLELWTRTDVGWTLEVVRGEGSLRLQAHDCVLELGEVYRNPLGD